MDDFETQAAHLHLKEGHEGTDLSVGMILAFLGSLAVCGFAAFLIVFGFYRFLQHMDKESQPPATVVEQQLRDERGALQPMSGKTPLPVGTAESVKPLPDYYGRGKIDLHLQRTFPGPRLQYDDVYDLNIFRTSEDRWLDSAGKNSDGTVHIPIDQAMNLIVQHGLPNVPEPYIPPMLPTAVPMVPAGPSRR
ncbi:MAG TPA: hypothetical protein VFP59_18675 [Candidatus Angelobacter sp.]|nr:hypothetical protein [Candidatus Angelobacter sp.]